MKLSKNRRGVLPVGGVILGSLLAAAPVASSAVVEVTFLGLIPDQPFTQSIGIADYIVAGALTYDTADAKAAPYSSETKFATPTYILFGETLTNSSLFVSSSSEMGVFARAAWFNVLDAIDDEGASPVYSIGLRFSQLFDDIRSEFPVPGSSVDAFPVLAAELATERLLSLQAANPDNEFITFADFEGKTSPDDPGFSGEIPVIFSLAILPEPSSTTLLLLAAFGAVGLRKRRA